MTSVPGASQSSMHGGDAPAGRGNVDGALTGLRLPLASQSRKLGVSVGPCARPCGSIQRLPPTYAHRASIAGGLSRMSTIASTPGASATGTGVTLATKANAELLGNF